MKDIIFISAVPHFRRRTDQDLKSAQILAAISQPPLRANIDETVLLVLITEQGENRNQCEEQRNIFGFSHGFAGR
jgi:hypothetical protein